MLEIIHEYWLIFLVGRYPDGPLGGLALTVIVAVLAILCSIPVALLLALARISPWRPLAAVTAGFVWVIRGVPLLMLIFWAYFVIPKLFGQAISGFGTLVCALVIYQGAYMSEAIRAGIQAIPYGQTEAARSMGCSYLTMMRKIILPQALLNVLPSLTNQLVSIVKETSLGYVISVNELTFSANVVNNLVLTKPLEVFAILALLYFVICFSLSRSLRWLDGQVRYSRGMA